MTGLLPLLVFSALLGGTIYLAPPLNLVWHGYRVAKAVGDKRVIVAEQGFGRPFARVVVSGSGVIEKPSNQAN